MNYFERACALREELIENRRYFHENAEVGLHMPEAKAYVMKKLEEYGLKPQECGEGVTATLGSGGKVILLRADMDALPMPEESGLSFACPTKEQAHTCGHDFHAAMLLVAAKLLKEDEAALKGTVKFMFQPAEETFEGSRNMIEHGILEDPKPDVALAYHVSPGKLPIGTYLYNDSGTMMFSVDTFEIHIQGKGSHGAYPHLSIDPINIGTHIYLALQELIARESDPNDAALLTVGQFTAGSAANIIPDTAVLKGTMRTNKKEAREKLVRRLKEVSEATATVYGGSAEVVFTCSVPTLVCDSTLTKEIVGYMTELPIPNATGYSGIAASASEDFALIAEQIPSAFMYLSAGYADERGNYPAHNPKVQFNEDVLPIGAACLAHSAMRWLAEHKG
ncbi:MAG: amidohydrolase [Lachnospiraceae bacterium]|nr:amidohydrolase [Lachnospiraceae bacterium]